ncbi:MAG: hypothetical protein AAF497_10445 [Planctomycetota bacterium]|jgi:hypothetical protein
MAKGLTIMSVVIAVLILILFGLDLAIGFPFRKANMMLDIVFVICSIGLGYISWSTYREIR